MARGNPNPVMTEAFQANQFKKADEDSEPLAKENIQFRLGKSVDAAVRRLPNRSLWLRKVVTEAAQRELMGGER